VSITLGIGGKREIKRLNYYFHFYSMPKTGAFTDSEFRPSSRIEDGSSMNPKSPDKSRETHKQLPYNVMMTSFKIEKLNVEGL